MFTGIIASTGHLISILNRGGDLELGVDAPSVGLSRVAIGDSVSIQGACLTVTRKQNTRFFVDVSRETLDKTTLGQARIGARVNLELALRVGDPLGGHLVSGHIDALGTLGAAHQDARSWRMEFELPRELMRFVAAKGSICVDGVSLTVNRVKDSRFDVNVIPHTFEVTTLGALQMGAAVNIEIDLIARYLDRLVSKNLE